MFVGSRGKRAQQRRDGFVFDVELQGEVNSHWWCCYFEGSALQTCEKYQDFISMSLYGYVLLVYLLHNLESWTLSTALSGIPPPLPLVFLAVSNATFVLLVF